jgi:hypothetical protein
VEEKAQKKLQRQVQSLLKDYTKEDIEFLEQDDGGDDSEAAQIELPEVSEEGEQEITQHVVQKKKEEKKAKIEAAKPKVTEIMVQTEHVSQPSTSVYE